MVGTYYFPTYIDLRLVAYCLLFLMVTFLVVLLDLFVGKQIPSMHVIIIAK